MSHPFDCDPEYYHQVCEACGEGEGHANHAVASEVEETR